LSSRAAERNYRFDGRISREVLDNYLSRAVTFTDFLHGKGSVADNLRFLTNTGAKFVGRAIYRWGSEEALPALLETAQAQTRSVAARADPGQRNTAPCFGNARYSPVRTPGRQAQKPGNNCCSSPSVAHRMSATFMRNQTPDRGTSDNIPRPGYLDSHNYLLWHS
jgi:hypothetical protein